jgi:BirA family biotin operon repressor/biotin-[acetyl-CoA-carboxylase] ligase
MPVAPQSVALGRPRLHLRCTTSTNDRARELAIAGAPHGTLVTTTEQTAGRGRMGRSWTAPAGSSLLTSLVLRGAPAPLPLLAAVAVCDVAGPQARVKWPNDIVVQDGGHLRKLAGILTEGRPQEGWTILGIGLNVALRLEDLTPDLQETAATLGLPSDAIERTLGILLAALERRLKDPLETTLDAWRERDALHGHEVSWADSDGQAQGLAEGIDDTGRLVVVRPDGEKMLLEAGEVHLESGAARKLDAPT